MTNGIHYVKSIHFWSFACPYVCEYHSVFSPNVGKYGVEPFCVSVLVYFNSFCYSSVHAPESWKPLKYRSSRLEVFGVFKFHKTHGKATVSESLFNKVAGFRPASFLKQRSQHFFSIMQSFEEHLFYWVPPDDCFLK